MHQAGMSRRGLDDGYGIEPGSTYHGLSHRVPQFVLAGSAEPSDALNIRVHASLSPMVSTAATFRGRV